MAIGGLLLLRLVLWADWPEALRAAMLMVAASGIAAAAAAIPLKFFHPAYVLPTNAMVPTLKGRHFVWRLPTLRRRDGCGVRRCVRLCR